MDCLFCKIINGEIPSYKIYEDEFAYSFLDISNDCNGHILVIPKKHCKNILDCDKVTLSHLFQTVQKISRHLVDNCGFDGVNILNANGESAEQTVFHFHVHILPRKEKDGQHVFPILDKNIATLEEICDKLRIE